DVDHGALLEPARDGRPDARDLDAVVAHLGDDDADLVGPDVEPHHHRIPLRHPHQAPVAGGLPAPLRIFVFASPFAPAAPAPRARRRTTTSSSKAQLTLWISPSRPAQCGSTSTRRASFAS